MSNYGVLVVECENSYQVVAAVSSRAEALEMASNYLNTAGPELDCLPPEAFVVNRRGVDGFYNVREVLADEDVVEYGECVAAIRRCQRQLGVGGDFRGRNLVDLAAYETRLAVLGGAR